MDEEALKAIETRADAAEYGPVMLAKDKVTDDELKAIETRLSALPGLPWRGDNFRSWNYAIVANDEFIGEFTNPDERDDMVEVMNSVPTLITEVRKLRAIEAAAREFHEADEATVAAWADFGAAGGTAEAHERYRAAEERRTAARSALSREVLR